MAASCTNEYQGGQLPSTNSSALPWWLDTAVNDTNLKKAYQREPCKKRRGACLGQGPISALFSRFRFSILFGHALNPRRKIPKQNRKKQHKKEKGCFCVRRSTAEHPPPFFFQLANFPTQCQTPARPHPRVEPRTTVVDGLVPFYINPSQPLSSQFNRLHPSSILWPSCPFPLSKHANDSTPLQKTQISSVQTSTFGSLMHRVFLWVWWAIVWFFVFLSFVLVTATG